jgi:hypothetical protein
MEEIEALVERCKQSEIIKLYTVYLDSNNTLETHIIKGIVSYRGPNPTLPVFSLRYNGPDNIYLNWRNIPTFDSHHWFAFTNYWHAYAALLQWRAKNKKGS